MSDGECARTCGWPARCAVRLALLPGSGRGALYHLTIAGEWITTTDEHPFMVAGLGWIRAVDLRPGDLLVTAELANGLADETTAVGAGAGTVRLDAVDIETLDDKHPITVYNFHVRALHTYYVVAGDQPIPSTTARVTALQRGCGRRRTTTSPTSPTRSNVSTQVAYAAST